MFIDTHAHIDFFENPKQVVEEALEAGVGKIILPAVEPDKFEKIISIIDEFDCVYGGLGVHPTDADKFDNNVAKKIAELSRHTKIVAMGEIGLDYHWDKENKKRQQDVFKAQLEIAKSLDLPLMIHDREAHFDTLEILKEYEIKKAILHCYSGSLEFAKECVNLGYLLGIGGVVTFKNARNVKNVVKEIPLDKIVLETDCPYLAPHPFRGEENAPRYIPFIAKEIAFIKDIPLKEVEEITTANALSFFDIEGE